MYRRSGSSHRQVLDPDLRWEISSRQKHHFSLACLLFQCFHVSLRFTHLRFQYWSAAFVCSICLLVLTGSMGKRRLELLTWLPLMAKVSENTGLLKFFCKHYMLGCWGFLFYSWGNPRLPREDLFKCVLSLAPLSIIFHLPPSRQNRWTCALTRESPAFFVKCIFEKAV